MTDVEKNRSLFCLQLLTWIHPLITLVQTEGRIISRLLLFF